MANGINIAIDTLYFDKDIFVSAIKRVVSSDSIIEIDCNSITEKLFEVMNNDEVFSLFESAPYSTINIWMYSYFETIPKERIDNKQIIKLYSFLQNDSDKMSNNTKHRDLFVFQKYSKIDNDVVIKSASIILAKQSDSPFIVNTYCSSLFNSHKHKPEEVIIMFSKDINLLESIYLCVEKLDGNFDFSGEFLLAICLKDEGFLLTIANMLLEKKNQTIMRDLSERCTAFYNNENYIAYIDTIINEAFKKCKSVDLFMPVILIDFIKHLKDNTLLSIKIEKWITNYIEQNIKCKEKIKCLFVALSELSMSQHLRFISVLLNLCNDYELFEIIPLIPRSYSWGKSAIPLFSSWIKELEFLLPMLNGIVFIKHKQRVESTINMLRLKIKDEEVNEVLTG